MYPTEVEVRFEDCQVENRPLEDSMEQDEGSEENILPSTNSPPPPPFGVGIETLGSFPSREPGIGGYQALGPRAPPRGLPFGPPLTASQGFSAPLLGGTVILTLLELV